MEAADTSPSMDPLPMEDVEEAVPPTIDEELEKPPGIDGEIEGVFESVGLGHDENDDEEMDSYSDEEESDDNYLSDEEEMHTTCNGVIDLFFTGKVGFSCSSFSRLFSDIIRRLIITTVKRGITITSMVASVAGMD